MVVIDASVWVAYFNARDHFHGEAARWFAGQPEPTDAYRAPNIVLAEDGAALARMRVSPERGNDVVAAMLGNPHLVLEPISPALAVRAGAIAMERRIRGCDAIHVALAEASGLPLLTFDRQQARRAAGLIEVVDLGAVAEP
jgi:predicted nucleic acid-binding protein